MATCTDRRKGDKWFCLGLGKKSLKMEYSHTHTHTHTHTTLLYTPPPPPQPPPPHTHALQITETYAFHSWTRTLFEQVWVCLKMTMHFQDGCARCTNHTGFSLTSQFWNFTGKDQHIPGTKSAISQTYQRLFYLRKTTIKTCCTEMFDVCMHVCVLDREGELGVCKYCSSSSMDSCVSYWLQWLSDQIL